MRRIRFPRGKGENLEDRRDMAQEARDYQRRSDPKVTHLFGQDKIDYILSVRAEERRRQAIINARRASEAAVAAIRRKIQ